MTFEHSNLGAWVARLRTADPALTLKDSLDEIDRVSLDNAAGFAAEHARRYVATDGADDGWDSPRPIVETRASATSTVRGDARLLSSHPAGVGGELLGPADGTAASWTAVSCPLTPCIAGSRAWLGPISGWLISGAATAVSGCFFSDFGSGLV